MQDRREYRVAFPFNWAAMRANQPVTVADHVDWAEQRLTQSKVHSSHGCTNLRDESIWATLHVANLIDQEYEDVHDQSLSEMESSTLRELIERRIETRKPLAYLIRESWFAGYAFYIDERAIVPRSHIGDLIQDDLGPWVNPAQIHRILDLCTGSGCIAVSLALSFPNTSVDASDIDADALEVARINIERFQCSEQVRVIQSDLYDNLATQQYDLIVSNPPYIDSSWIDNLPKEYQHEPRHAFEAGEDGLDFAQRILSQSRYHLTDHGFLMMELGNSADDLEAKFPNVPFLWLTSRGGESVVLLISAEELKMYESEFALP